MINLIGLHFKRNVYGLSNWTSRIVDAEIIWSITDNGFKPIIQIKSTNGIWYNLNEIIFVDIWN